MRFVEGARPSEARTPRRIGLVGCGKSKHKGVFPARELYKGRVVRWSLEEAERNCDTVFILSAKHHLLPLDRPIRDYEQELPNRRAELLAWARVVVSQLKELYGEEPLHLVLYAGKKYATVAELIPDGWTSEQPMERLPIGRRQQWLKERRVARRNEGMGEFTVLRAAQLRAGDEVDRVLADRGAKPLLQVSEVVLEGAEIIVRAAVEGRRIERRLAGSDPVVVRGRCNRRRPDLAPAPAPELARTSQRERVEGAIFEWAKRTASPLSPGHRAQLANIMVEAGDGARGGGVTPAMVGTALLAAGAADGPFNQKLEAVGVTEPTRRAFDAFWLGQAESELAGAGAQVPPFWTVPLPASPRLIVVTERAVDALAYHQAEGREGTVYVAVGGPLEGDRAKAVQDLLGDVQSRAGDRGMAPMVVAAFGATLDGTVQAKALRSLRPPGMAFDRHAPPRGRWGERLSEPHVARGRTASIGL